MSEETPIVITVDGKQIETEKGQTILRAAEKAGIYIPRFCDHPRLKPVGMCRMCMVEVEGPRGPALVPSCYIEVADGQVVNTQETSETAKEVQEGILEFLLANHPLDCPVCDRGGECPLQDQAFGHGPGETRFVEEKRHWEKPIDLSPLVLLDRERCIQCARCTRFADEIAGDPLIEFINRGSHTEVNTFPDAPFSSYFSGNTVQICPVGALLAAPYRFKARPWDLSQVEGTCTVCSVGCRVAVQSSANQLTRYIGLDSDPVNQGWLCDKGRFSYDAINSDQRLRAPLVRKNEELVEASWGEALAAAARAISEAKRLHGPDAVAVLGGARLANEDAYAWAKLAKGVIGTDAVDAQMGDGLPADIILGLPQATIDDACSARVVVLLAPDLKEELPVLYLRLRSAAVESGVQLIELTPRRTGLARYAAASLTYRAGEATSVARALVGSGAAEDVGGVSGADITRAREVVGDGEGVVVVIGRPSLAEHQKTVGGALVALRQALPNATFLPVLRRGNVRGALEMGLAPGMLPGRVSIDEAGEWFGSHWPGVPANRGHGCAAILADAAEGKIQALVLLGADPLADFPDRELARRALSGAGTVVAVDTFKSDSVGKADVVLPAAMFAERPGTTTNIEGRVTRLGQKITAPGVAWPDWTIAVELAARMDVDLGFTSLEEIAEEIERVAPAFAGLTRATLAASRDGCVIPVPDGGAPTAGDAPPTDIATEASTAVDEPESNLPPALSDPRGTAASSASAAARPALHVWDGDGGGDFEVPQDAYSLRLVTSRPLYDEGVTVRMTPALAALVGEKTVHLHPTDLERLGVTSGGRVRVRSSRSSLVLTAVADSALPRGSAWMPFNVGAPGAADLIDAAQLVTEIRVESP